MSDTRIEGPRTSQSPAKAGSTAMAAARSTAANAEDGAVTGFSSVLALLGNGIAGMGSGLAVEKGSDAVVQQAATDAETLSTPITADVQLLAGQIHAPWMSLVGQTTRLDTRADVDLRQGVATDFLSGRGHATLLAQRQSLEPEVNAGPAAFMTEDSKPNLPLAQSWNGQAATHFDNSAFSSSAATADDSSVRSELKTAADTLQSAAKQVAEVVSSPARHTAAPITQHMGSVNLQGMTAVAPQEIAGLKEWLQAGRRGELGDESSSNGGKAASPGDLLASAVAVGATQASMGAGAQTGGQDAGAFAQTADGQTTPAGAEPEIFEQVAFWVHQKQHNAALSIEHEGRQIQVQVQLNGQEAHVRFGADDEQARQLLADGQSQLRELLQAQGLQLAGVSVGSGKADSQGGGSGGREAAKLTRVRMSGDTDSAALPQVASPRAAGMTGVDLFV